MSEIIEKTFTVSSPARLDLSNIRGSVEVRSGEEALSAYMFPRIQTPVTPAVPKLSSPRQAMAPSGSHKIPGRCMELAVWLLSCRVDYVVQAAA